MCRPTPLRKRPSSVRSCQRPEARWRFLSPVHGGPQPASPCPPFCAHQVFRIGHLGNMNELMLVSALAGAEMAMIDAGVPIRPGSGVAKAIEYWQQTSSVIKTRESLMQ
jgi:hypothetical protein